MKVFPVNVVVEYNWRDVPNQPETLTLNSLIAVFCNIKVPIKYDIIEGTSVCILLGEFQISCAVKLLKGLVSG